MGFEVFKIDFIDIVSASMLSFKLGSRLDLQEIMSSCWMALFISSNSYAPGGISISKQSDTNPISSRTIIFILSSII